MQYKVIVSVQTWATFEFVGQDDISGQQNLWNSFVVTDNDGNNIKQYVKFFLGVSDEVIVDKTFIKKYRINKGSIDGVCKYEEFKEQSIKNFWDEKLLPMLTEMEVGMDLKFDLNKEIDYCGELDILNPLNAPEGFEFKAILEIRRIS